MSITWHWPADHVEGQQHGVDRPLGDVVVDQCGVEENCHGHIPHEGADAGERCQGTVKLKYRTYGPFTNSL